MRSRSKGHAAVGGISALLGAAGLVLGIARPAFAAGTFLETPVWALLITGGCVLALAGAFILIFTFRAPPEEADVIPAHVAFNSRMAVKPLTPPVAAPARRNPPAAPARGANGNGAAPAPMPTPKMQPPPPPAQQRVGPSRTDIDGISAQISELTKKINKAGVMLATGQLSQEGYLAYVDDLKRQRGNLEAARVRAELRTT